MRTPAPLTQEIIAQTEREARSCSSHVFELEEYHIVRDPNNARGMKCPRCTAIVDGRRAIRKQNEQLEKSFGGANIPAKYRKQTFDSFPADGDHEAKEYLQDYASGLLAAKNIYLWGDFSHGKTGLAIAAAREFIERGQSVLYMRSNDYFARINAQRYQEKLNGENVDMIELARSVKYFILDDLAADSLSESVSRDLLELVEYRTIQHDDLFTLFTSNKDIRTLARSFKSSDPQRGLRIAQRIADNFHLLQVRGVALRSRGASILDDLL